MPNKLIYCVLLNKWHSIEYINNLEDIFRSQEIPKCSTLDFIVITNRKDFGTLSNEVIFVDTDSSGVLLNQALDIARNRKYDYFFKSDADDRPFPNRVVSQLQCMKSNPDKVFFSTALKINRIGDPEFKQVRIYPQKPTLFHYLSNISFANCSLAINLNMLTGKEFKTTPFLEDKHFFSRKETFSKIFNQPEILIDYNLHENARASAQIALKNFFYDLKLTAQLKPMHVQFYFLAFLIFLLRWLLPIRFARQIRDNFFKKYKIKSRIS